MLRSNILALTLFVIVSFVASQTTDIESAYVVSGTNESSVSGIFTAFGNNESAILVENAGTFLCTGCTVIKTGNTSNTTDGSFSDLNAAVSVQINGTLTMRHSTIYTDGIAATGAKVYEDGSSAYLYDLVVAVTAEFALGIYQAGGYIYAEGVTVTTNGKYSGCFSTDEGGGIMEIYNSEAYTLAEDSVLVYSTGNITATGIIGQTHLSPAGVIDGTNYITLVNPTISVGPVEHGVFQIFNSGDSASGTANVWVTGGSIDETRGVAPFLLTANAIFEVQFTEVEIALKTSTFVNLSANYKWGTTGSNGGTASVNLTRQSIEGNVYVDEISSATLLLADYSNLTGSINSAKTGGSVYLEIDETSVWTVTDNSYVTGLGISVSNNTSSSGTTSDLSHLIVTTGNYTVYYTGNSTDRKSVV